MNIPCKQERTKERIKKQNKDKNKNKKLKKKKKKNMHKNLNTFHVYTKGTFLRFRRHLLRGTSLNQN